MKEVIASLGIEVGATRSAIKKWRQRGFVPPKFRFPILDAAEERGVALSRDDLDFKPALESKARKTKKPARAGA